MPLPQRLRLARQVGKAGGQHGGITDFGGGQGRLLRFCAGLMVQKDGGSGCEHQRAEQDNDGSFAHAAAERRISGEPVLGRFALDPLEIGW